QVVLVARPDPGPDGEQAAAGQAAPGVVTHWRLHAAPLLVRPDQSVCAKMYLKHILHAFADSQRCFLLKIRGGVRHRPGRAGTGPARPGAEGRRRPLRRRRPDDSAGPTTVPARLTERARAATVRPPGPPVARYGISACSTCVMSSRPLMSRKA